jgi:hypothetical protein
MTQPKPQPVEVSPADARRIVRSTLFATLTMLHGQPMGDDKAKAYRLRQTAEVLAAMVKVLNDAAAVYDSGMQATAKITLPEIKAPDLQVTVPDTVPTDWSPESPDQGTDKPAE